MRKVSTAQFPSSSVPSSSGILPQSSSSPVAVEPDRKEAGFTLVELLVTCAIIFILAGLALEAFSIYRQKAYYSLSEQMMGQTRTALEAGKVDSENFTGNLLFTGTAPGPAVAGDGPTIVPGLTLPKDFYVYVFHNPNCATTGCMEDYVITRHCNVDEQVVYFKTYQMGASTIPHAAPGGPCP